MSGRETSRSSPSCPEVKNAWSCRTRVSLVRFHGLEIKEALEQHLQVAVRTRLLEIYS
jgi:hypothetical protein